MTPTERRAVSSLALLYATRMLGLFMVLPVFMLYGQQLEGATDLLLGVAIGAYGLSQALFQIPYGALSDRFGRKPLIWIGLLLFLAGSVLAAVSEHIYGVILGRFLQGAGAIASVLMALLSDLTSEESRTKGMAVIGMSIGLSFSVALILGPLVAELGGLAGVFWFTAALAILAQLWLHWVVPNPVQRVRHRDSMVFREQLGVILRNRDLQRLDLGIFTLHLCLTAMFVAVPRALVESAGIAKDDHWWVYLSVMILSFFAMVPFIIIGEKKRKLRTVFLGAIALLAGAALSTIWTRFGFWGFWLSLFAFFMAFNLLEASLPSLISKLSPAGSRGTAMGVYSTAQFLGAFVGGVLGGWTLSRFGESGVFLLCALACLLWFVFARPMRNPNPESSMMIHLGEVLDQQQAEQISEALCAVAGVEEAVVVLEDRVAYLKVVRSQLDLAQLQRFQVRPEA